MRLNLGCGHVQPEGWINVDGSARAWLASTLPWIDRPLARLGLLPRSEFGPHIRYASFFRRLPWPDRSADAVYLGEVLEHFTRADGERLVHECVRVLAPGGLLRIRVPDNVRFWRNYIEAFDRVCSLPPENRSDEHTIWVEKFFRDICVTRRGALRSMGHFHKWQYDELSLIHLFEGAGLVDVARRCLHQSAIPDIAAVETRDDLIVEGRKP